MRVDVIRPWTFNSPEEALAFGRLLMAFANKGPSAPGRHVFHRKRHRRMAGK